ncbi:MAG: serine hydrolase domain-containing protein [Thermoanaerobaculia bacterium]
MGSSTEERPVRPPRDPDIADRVRERVDAYLEREIDLGSFPGAVYAFGDRSGVFLARALGHSVIKPARINNTVDTIYDVASLTKPLITATLTLAAAAEGRIDLEDPVARHLPELDAEEKSGLTFIDLLTHRAGYQAWYPLYTQGEGDEAYLSALNRRPLRYRPGTREIYSCLGYITLHLALERIYGASVEQLAAEKIFAPLGLRNSLFNPPPPMKYQIAATEWGNANERQMVAARDLPFRKFRTYMIWGEVNDGNAYYMGGVAGNAGLFATASDVFAIARAWLDESLLPAEIVRLALRNYTIGLEENRALGWQLQNPREDHPSSVMSETCFGHTGFTGTSVWVDPARDLVVSFLTNRLHPTVQPLNMQAIRRNVHRLIVEEWDRAAGSWSGG